MDNKLCTILTKFLIGFTDDQASACELLTANYNAIIQPPQEEAVSFIPEYSRMLQRTRQIALKALSERPVPDICWSERRTFFPISNAMTAIHKEVFCCRFYFGLSEQQAATKLRLSVAQVHIYLIQVVKDIASQSIVKITDISDI
jgi:hypothetical protein